MLLASTLQGCRVTYSPMNISKNSFTFFAALLFLCGTSVSYRGNHILFRPSWRHLDICLPSLIQPKATRSAHFRYCRAKFSPEKCFSNALYTFLCASRLYVEALPRAFIFLERPKENHLDEFLWRVCCFKTVIVQRRATPH